MRRVAAIVAILACVAGLAFYLTGSNGSMPSDLDAVGQGVGEEGPADSVDADVVNADSDEAERTAEAAEASARTDDRLIKLAGRLVDDKGKGLAGVELRFLDRNPRFGFPGLNTAKVKKPTPPSTKSDAEGRFALRIPANKAGRLRPHKSDWVWREGDVTLNRSREDLDLGELAMQMGAILRGKIVSKGTPIAKAKVTGWSWGRNGNHSHNTTSDREGRFEFRGLTPGQLQLTIAATGFMGATKSLRFEPSQQRSENIELEPGRVLSGRVVDDRGKGIAKANVWIQPKKQRNGGGYGQVKTDAQGRFRVDTLAEGPYRVSASCKGFKAANKTDIRVGSEIQLELQRLGRIEGILVSETNKPIEGSRVWADLKEKAGGSHHNIYSRLSVEYSLAGGDFAAAPHLFQGAQRGTKTDKNGRFVLEAVPIGDCWIHVRGAHEALDKGPIPIVVGQRIENFELSVDQGATLLVVVHGTDGKPVEGASVTVKKPKPASGPKPPRNSPMSFGRIEVADGGWASNLVMPSARSGPLATGKTDKNGECRLHGLDKGKVVIDASHKEWISADQVSAQVDPEAEAKAELKLKLGGFLEFHCRDASGKYLAGGGIRVVSTDKKKSKRHASADATGRARIGPLAPGRYQAMLVVGGSSRSNPFGWRSNSRSPEAPNTTKTIDVVGGKTEKIQLTMPTLARLVGSVRGAGGGIAKARVILTPKKPSDKKQPRVRYFNAAMTPWSATCDAQGQFEIKDLLPGLYKVTMRRPGQGAAFEDQVEIVGTNVHQRDFTLHGAEVVVTVRDAAGAAIPKLKLQLQPTKPQGGTYDVDALMGYTRYLSSNVSATTDASGRAVLKDVPPGDWKLRVTTSGWAQPKLEPLSLQQGQRIERSVQLVKSPYLLVECYDGSKPANQFDVRVTSIPDKSSRTPAKAGSKGKTTVTSTSSRGWRGKKTFTRLQPGAYTIKVRRTRDRKNPKAKRPWSAAKQVTLAPGGKETVRVDLPVR